MPEPINHNSNERIKKPTSQLASKLAAESYKQMIDNFELGDICIVEQCYILLGTKPEHNSLLLSALQNLVNFEAPSKQDFIFDKMLGCKSFVHDRHDILEEYQSKLSLPSDVNTKRINKVRKYEMISLDLNFSFPAIVYSLPLPQTSNEYGIAQLILRFKLPMLLNVLILLLLERSVLIIGDKSEDVSSCAFALLDLLKPYKWASVFLPSLSEDMIDFVTAPVPFIAAMVGKDEAALKRIEMDSRVKDERMTGLTVIDVTSCKILWTEEVEIRKNMFARVRSMMKHWYRYNEPYHYQERLEELKNNEMSSLHSFKQFIQHGLSPNELITLNSIKESIASFFAHFAGSISKYKDGWKDVTAKDSLTNEINFSGDKFYAPTTHLLEFQKLFSKTQLLVSYFEEKRMHSNVEEYHAAQLIADWVHFNIRRKRNKRLISFWS